MRVFCEAITAITFCAASAAAAAPGDPVRVGDGVTVDPIIDGRFRYEQVSVAAPLADADALTMRLRAGVEVTLRSRFSLLVEGEGMLRINGDYNGTVNGRTGFATIADPESIGLNRAQLRYNHAGTALTLGRQRINIDDQRFVGAAAWRQNEQTFDAVRFETSKLGPVAIDVTYAVSQHTVFGSEAGPRSRYDGDFLLANAVLTRGPFKARLFDYRVDYDGDEPLAIRRQGSNSYGGRVDFTRAVSGGLSVNAMASYARQRDTGANPLDYAADYFAGSLGGVYRGFAVTARYEELGSDRGRAAFQTPLATLHAFNGWADLFLVTPATGLRDYQITAGYTAPATAKGLRRGAAALISYHRYESAFGAIDYGSEWNAQLRTRLGPVTALAKYARYDADRFGRDTDKFWLQFEVQY